VEHQGTRRHVSRIMQPITAHASPPTQNSALIWTMPVENARIIDLIDIGDIWAGRFLAMTAETVRCYSQRTGRLVWESNKVPKAADCAP